MLGERVLQVWRWYLHRFKRYRKKTRGGLEIAPPPVGRGLSLETSKFWGSGSWVSRVSPHIQILRSWVSKVLRLSKFWGPGFSGSHCISKSWGPGFPGSYGITQFWGPRSIKVPDLGLSEPSISNLFGTLAQVWSYIIRWIPRLQVVRG